MIGLLLVSLLLAQAPWRGAYASCHALRTIPAGPISGELLGQPNNGPQALAFLTELLITGKRNVTVVFDGYRMGDPAGRRFAYVFLPDKTLLNAELIRRGFGYADRQGAHPRRDEFIALEEAARQRGVGVWTKEIAGQTPTPTPARDSNRPVVIVSRSLRPMLLEAQIKRERSSTLREPLHIELRGR